MSNDFRFLMYQSTEENVSVNAIIKDETIWLSQKGMAELFGVQPPAIAKHLQNIYDEGELSRDATLSKMEIVQKEGDRDVTRSVIYYIWMRLSLSATASIPAARHSSASGQPAS